MSNRRRSISRNTRPRSVKIPISFLRASARERVLASSTPSPSIAGVDTRTGPPAMYRRPPCDFRMDNAFQRDARGKIALFSLGRDLARGNARGKRSRDRISKTTFGYLPIRWIDNARKARRKSCGRGGKRVSITIDGQPRAAGSFDHYRAVGRCEIERLIQTRNRTYCRRISPRACKGKHPAHTPRGASSVRSDFTARCAPRTRGSFPFPARGEKTRFARCSRRVYARCSDPSSRKKRFIYANEFFHKHKGELRFSRRESRNYFSAPLLNAKPSERRATI